MKGKRTFTKAEAEQIKKFIREKNRVDKSRQKGIRQKIRNLGFYYSDFSSDKSGYNIEDFERLFKSGAIILIGGEKKTLMSEQKNAETKLYETGPGISNINKDIIKIFRKNKFDPLFDTELIIPNKPGNYIICLRIGSVLPSSEIVPKMKKYEELNVIYTGVSAKSLRGRDYKQHFTGNNAGRSTLRESLGSLMKFHKVPRDKDPATGKTKFMESDERKLTQWMHSNLILFFYSNNNYKSIEDELISYFNPPLNLQGNKNSINLDFRYLLSKLRSINT